MISSHPGADLEEPKIYSGFCVTNDSLKKDKFRKSTSILDWAFCKNSKRLKVWKPLAIFARISILADRGGYWIQIQ